MGIYFPFDFGPVRRRSRAVLYHAFVVFLVSSDSAVTAKDGRVVLFHESDCDSGQGRIISAKDSGTHRKSSVAVSDQDRFDQIIGQAIKKHSEKDYKAAISLYLQAIEILPEKDAAWFNLAACYYAVQMYPESRSVYERLYQREPKKFVDDLWLIATILENNNEGNAALEIYTKYIIEAPGGTYFSQTKDRIEALRKDPNDTMKIKTEAEIARDKSADDFYKAAVAAQQAKNWKKAEELYKKAYEIRPKDPTIPFGLGTMFQQKDDPNAALKWIGDAIYLAGADPKFDEKTLAVFKAAVKATKTDLVKPIVEEAIRKQSEGDQASAITLYRKALETDPDNARIWSNLSQAYQLTDQFDKARECQLKVSPDWDRRSQPVRRDLVPPLVDGLDFDPLNEEENARHKIVEPSK